MNINCKSCEKIFGVMDVPNLLDSNKVPKETNYICKDCIDEFLSTDTRKKIPYLRVINICTFCGKYFLQPVCYFYTLKCCSPDCSKKLRAITVKKARSTPESRNLTSIRSAENWQKEGYKEKCSNSIKKAWEDNHDAWSNALRETSIENFKKAQRIGVENKRARQKELTFNCFTCGKEKTLKLSPYNYELKSKKEHLFCCHRCEIIWASTISSKQRHQAYLDSIKTVLLTCDKCKKNFEFTAPEYEINRRRSSKHIFCSQYCQRWYNWVVNCANAAGIKPNGEETEFGKFLDIEFPGKFKYNYGNEKRLNGKLPDFTYIENDNIGMEYYGDRYHANPAQYKATDKLRLHNKFTYTAQEIWDNDKNRLEDMKKAGGILLIIWAKDFKENKPLVIDKIKNFLQSNITPSSIPG